MKSTLRVFALLSGAALTASALAQTVLLGIDQANAAAQVHGIDMTPDARYVAFSTINGNVVPGDFNSTLDVFVRDRVANTFVRASVSSAGVEGGGPSFQPHMSADGRYAVFTSDASNLVLGDTNGVSDVFVRDLVVGTTTRASVDSAGAQANAGANSAFVSDDGRFVTFTSTATNLDARATSVGVSQVYVRDMLLGTTRAVSVTTGGAIANGPSLSLSISGDGRQVLISSTAQNLGGPPDAIFDLFLHDLTTGTTRVLSTDPSGFLPFNGGGFGALSRDGRYAVLGTTRSGTDEVVLARADLFTGWVDFVSRDTFGNTRSDEFVRSTAISSDGRFIAWSSSRNDYVPNDTNGVSDVFVRDMRLGTTRRVNYGPEYVQANLDTFLTGRLSVTDDGKSVAYMSFATNLGPANPALVASYLSTEATTTTHDLVFNDLQQRSILLGELQVNRVLQWEWASQRPGINWVTRGVGDFSNDGKPDVLVQHTGTRELWVGFMEGVNITSWNPVSQIPNPGWRVVGVGDFTGNGRASILFQQDGSRRLSLALMNGVTILQWANIAQVPNVPWEVAATGDLNGDTFADILFQHGGNNTITIAYCQGANILSWVLFNQNPNPGWRLRATGHFGGGPGLDLAFQHVPSGAITFAYCNANVVEGWANVASPGSRYQLVGAGPF